MDLLANSNAIEREVARAPGRKVKNQTDQGRLNSLRPGALAPLRFAPGISLRNLKLRNVKTYASG